MGTDIFERLYNGDAIPADDGQMNLLREASYATKKLVLETIMSMLRRSLRIRGRKED